MTTNISALTTGVDSVTGDSANDVVTMTPTTLTPGDTVDGGLGVDSLKATSSGTYDFAGVDLTGVEIILGSSGDDTFVFANGLPAGVTFNSSGGNDSLVTGSDVVLADIEAEGDWTLHAASGVTVTYTLDDADAVPFLFGDGAHVTVDASRVDLTAEDRATLFTNGIETVRQAGGVTFSADGSAQRLGPTLPTGSVGRTGEVAMTALSGGGYVLTWEELNGGAYDIQAQVFDNAGAPVSGPNRVNFAHADNQLLPSVTALAGGGFVVVWQAVNPGGYIWLAKAQVFDASGGRVGSEFTVGAPTGDGSFHPDVAALADGGFAIAWSDYDLTNGAVHVNLYAANGAPVGSQIQANSDVSGRHDFPSITGLADGGFAVAWWTNAEPYQRVFDAAGLPVSAQAIVNGADASSWGAEVTGLDDGTYIVTWSNTHGDALRLQRYHADGTVFGATVVLADDATTAVWVGSPMVTADGGYVLTWREAPKNDFTDIHVYAQRFDASGAKVGGQILITTAAATGEPVVTETASGALIVAWNEMVGEQAATFKVQQRVVTPLDYHVLTSGTDTVSGGDDDTLVVGAATDINAADSLAGGAGTDRLELTASGVVDLTALAGFSGFEQIVGASGDDTFVVNASTLAGVTSIDGRTGRDVLQLGTAGTLNLSALSLSNIELIAGTSGNDTLTGGAGNDSFAGLAGADAIDGGAGSDTADYSASAAGVSVNLTTRVNSGGDAQGDTLTRIENLTGSAFNDALVGDALANVLTGGAGDDVLNGQGGADTAAYAGAAGAVTVSLSLTGAQNTVAAGSDTLISIENLIGSSFDDTLSGNVANNLLDGGAGFDTASYANAAGAVTVNLGAIGAQNTGGAGTDTLVSIEAVIGSAFNDTLTGNAGNNLLDGGDGNDLLVGGAGDDTLIGGAGIDAVNFAAATGAVYVFLSRTAPQDTGAGVDTLIGIENVIGSNFNDTLVGDAGDNVLIGGLGNDDLDGGAGSDTVNYSVASGPVTVSLAISGPQNTVGAGTDTLANFENLTGSSFDDALAGDAGANIINGGAGSDTVSYATAGSAVSVSLANTGQQNTGAGGLDTLISIENVIGSAFDDTIEGDAGANGLTGGAGNDTVSYASASAGVTVDLAALTAQNTVGAGLDTLSGFENVTGSAFNDILLGDAGANVINGGLGVDIVSYANATAPVTVNLGLTGAQNTQGAGIDTLVSIEGVAGTNYDDLLLGSAGADILDGKAGSDMMRGGLGGDTYVVDDIGDAIVELANEGVDWVNVYLSGYALADNVENMNVAVAGAVGLGNGLDNEMHAANSGSTLRGLAGNDTLFGGDVADTLEGGAGADTLIGGYGADILTGGEGADIFKGTTVGMRDDTITDFSFGDRIQITNADPERYSYTFNGTILTVNSGSLGEVASFPAVINIGVLPAGYHLKFSAAPQGIYIGLEAEPIPNNGLSGDFNGDGKDDLLWRSDAGQMSNWLGQANGGFVGNDANAFVNVPAAWRVVGAGDFNGDGRDDIFWRSAGGDYSDWLGQANGGFAANDAYALGRVPTNWQVAGVGDFNGDGRDDLLWRNTVNGQMSDWLGQANGGFQNNDANALVTVAANWKIVGVGDFNGDNRDDILWRADAGQLSNWLGQANGGFVGNDMNAFVNVPGDWHVVGVGDFNGDGRSDILWRSDAGLMSNWLGTASGGWSGNDANAMVSVPTDWFIAGVGDYNGDGRDDIMWRHTSGAMSNWLGQANGGFVGNDANAYQVVDPIWHIQVHDLFAI